MNRCASSPCSSCPPIARHAYAWATVIPPVDASQSGRTLHQPACAATHGASDGNDADTVAAHHPVVDVLPGLEHEQPPVLLSAHDPVRAAELWSVSNLLESGAQLTRRTCPPLPRTASHRRVSVLPCAGPPRVARHSYGQRTRLPQDDSQFTFLARSSFRIHTTTALPEKILTPGMHRGEAIAAPRSPLPAHRREFGVRRIAPPGSTARGEASEVPFGRKADLVTPGALKPRRGPSSGMRQSMSRKAELERSRRVAREGRDWTEPSKKGAYEEGPY